MARIAARDAEGPVTTRIDAFARRARAGKPVPSTGSPRPVRGESRRAARDPRAVHRARRGGDRLLLWWEGEAVARGGGRPGPALQRIELGRSRAVRGDARPRCRHRRGGDPAGTPRAQAGGRVLLGARGAHAAAPVQ